jgi:hypothetical protein
MQFPFLDYDAISFYKIIIEPMVRRPKAYTYSAWYLVRILFLRMILKWLITLATYHAINMTSKITVMALTDRILQSVHVGVNTTWHINAYVGIWECHVAPTRCALDDYLFKTSEVLRVGLKMLLSVLYRTLRSINLDEY